MALRWRKARRLMSRRVTSGLLSLVIVGSLLGGVAAQPSSATGEERCGRVVKGWITVPYPDFDSLTIAGEDVAETVGLGDDTMTDYAVVPDDPSDIFVTNGTVIARTADFGCSWTTIFPDRESEASQPVAVPLDRVEDLELVATADGSVRLLAALSSPVLGDDISIPLPAKPHESIPGPSVLVSHDLGDSWTRSVEGFPNASARIDRLVISPSDPDVAYATVVIAGASRAGSRAAVYRSRDGGSSWEQRSEDFIRIGAGAVSLPPDLSGPLAIDPHDPDILWSGGRQLARSSDGGATWSWWLGASAEAIRDVSSMAISSGGTERSTFLVAAVDSIRASHDVGLTWDLRGLPPSVSESIAYEPDLDVTVVTAAADVFVYRAPERWIRIGRPGHSYRDGRSFSGRRPGFIFDDASEASFQILFADVLSKPPKGRPGHEDLRPNDAGLLSGCTGGVAPPLPGAQPAPLGSGPIYVQNFVSGCLVAFDPFGNSIPVARTPQYAEGIAFDPLGRIIVAARHSHQLLRVDPYTNTVNVIDDVAFMVEGPSFDLEGNLYVSFSDLAKVVEYPWPQFPGQEPRPVAEFGYFIEDTRIAPPASPYAGDLFVLYMDNEGDTSIAHLRRIDSRWKRLDDFGHLPPGFNSLGMAFSSEGYLYLPSLGTGARNAGRVIRFDPTGDTYEDFAQITNRAGVPQKALIKIDVTADDYVYITSCGQACIGVAPAQIASDNEMAVIRLDPTGERLYPDFSAGLDGPAGIAVPNVITGYVAPPIDPDPSHLPRPEPQTRAFAHPPPPGPPPHLPIPPVDPLPAPHPNAQAQPGVEQQAQQQAQQQSQAQTNPQSALVRQQQTQPQMAFVHAVQQMKEQLGAQNAMVRTVHQRSDPLAAVKFGMAMSALSMMLLYGFASATVRRAFVRER